MPEKKPVVTTTAITPVAEIQMQIAKQEKTYKDALPKQIPSELFVRTAQSAIALNPALANADRASLYMSCMEAAIDGLILNNVEAALVPFQGKVKYMPMIAGVIKKVRNSGEVKTFSTQVVYENDEFVYRQGTNPILDHTPLIPGNRGKSICVYAIAEMKAGGFESEVMTLEQIAEVRKCSKAKSGPWFDFPDEMARKSVGHRLAKRLPMSSDIMRLFQSSNFLYDMNEQPKQPAQPESPEGHRTKAEETILGSKKADETTIDEGAIDGEFSDGPAPEKDMI